MRTSFFKITFLVSLLALTKSAHAQSYSVQWTNLVGASVSGTTVTKTAGAGWGNSGASSVNTLPANTDGWMEYRITTSPSNPGVGLSSTDADQNFTSINFSFNISSGSAIENGVNKFTGTPNTVQWETYRIERIAGHIYYKRNGTIVYTSTQTSTSSLIVDIALNAVNSSVTNIVCSFGAPSQSPLTLLPNNAFWQNITGATVNSSNVLTKSASAGWGNSGASTLNTLNPNTDGWIQFTLDNTTQQKALGLSRTDADQNYTSIDYALVTNGATVAVMQAGVSKYTFTAAVNDVLRVERAGTTVLFKQNGTTVYTATSVYTTALIGDASLYDASATLANVQTSFWIPFAQGNVPDQLEFACLKNLYDSLAGSGWTTKTNWPAAGSWPTTATITQMGTWYGVTVTASDVSKLIITNNNLTGKLPASVGSLTGLTQIQLLTNKLSGKIPATIGNLKNLTTLYLYGNLMTGSIPSLSGLASLTTLNLSTNSFGGGFPDISGCSKLTSVTLSSCNLSGSLPAYVGSLSNLTTLVVNTNSLSGAVPEELGNLSKLTNLNLNNNSFSGTIPASLFSLTNLTSLSLSANTSLHGPIPAGLGNLTKLVTLNLGSCALTGSIPSELSALTSLQNLYLNTNQFTGTIPSLSNLTALVNLYLYSNQLTGALPSLSTLTNLQYLYVSSNKLSGTVPSLSSLTQLNYLYLDNNNFEGTLPDVGNSTQLLMIKVMNNNFSGAFPATIGSCTSLTYINASHNLFTSLPAGILSLPVATTINFDNNNLSAVPNFGSHVNKANLTLTLTNNTLDFFYLEPQVGASIHAVTYVPQKAISDVSGVSYKVSDTLKIRSRQPGSNSTITWQKQQANGTWATINSSNNDGSQQTFRQTSAQLTDEGTYRWSMTNTKVTGMTLQSGPIIATSSARLALNQWAFQYQYDQRRRMTAKRVPGADWVYMVYDDRDRLVMTQDGNQRSTSPYKWTFTKYDQFNRPIATGIKDTTVLLTQAQMQAVVNANYQKPSAQWGETYVGTQTGNMHGYSNKSYPVFTTGSTKDPNKYLTVAYYDNYAFVTDLFSATYQFAPADLSGQQSTNNTSVIGQATGGKVLVLGTTGYLQSAVYYDDKYRVIQTIADNNKGGWDRTTNIVDFAGRVLNTRSTHHTATHSDQTVAHRLVYDHMSRVKQVYHKVNTNAEILLTQNSYNEIGQLVDKGLHSTDNGNNFKQSTDYRYNIRGWLTSINNSQLTNDGITNNDSNDLFGMNLSYNDVISGMGNAAQYNGNISAIRWSNNLALGTVKDVAYSYCYDTLNRIKSAAYLTNPGAWTTSTSFAENGFKYDLNGNIKKLARTNANGANMDVLTYDYTGQGNAGNQLHSVTDAGDQFNGFADGNVSGDDYAYDANGNMTLDNNKAIDSIKYNHLNLPIRVKKHTGEVMKYNYDASGRKLKQQVYNATGTLVKTTEYDGEFIYQGDTLQFINHDEGRIVVKNGTNEYQYHLKDHLGNVRTTFTTQPTTDNPVATYETANYNTEQSQFLRYDDARVINSILFDHTHNGVTAYSERLSGSANEKTGIARSISVMPGDTIRMQVFAKYVDASNSSNTAALTNLLAQIMLGTASAGTVIDGANYNYNGITPFPFAGLAGESSSSGLGPKAFMNYIMFDRNFVPIINDASQTNFVRVTTAGKEDGIHLPYGNKFDSLYAQVVVKQAGYMYIYLSNEETTPVEVYFDDFKVTQVKSPVVQQEDFYPFGLAFNWYSRENIVSQNYLYQKKEWQQDIGLNLYDFMARQYDPTIGRTTTMDPHGERYVSFSSYSWTDNNPLKYVDPTGKDLLLSYETGKDKKTGKMTYGYYNYKNGSTYKGDNKFIKDFYAAVKRLRDKGQGKIIADLEAHHEQYIIKQSNGITKHNNGGSHSMLWDPNGGVKTDKGIVISPTTALNHEADHGLDELNNYSKHGASSIFGTDKQYETREERRVITGSEQRTAMALGEIKPGQVTRENHQGEYFKTAGPTTTAPATTSTETKENEQ